METRMSGEAVEEELQCLEGVCGVCGVRVCGWIWMWMWDVPVEIPICGWSLKLLFSGGDVAGLKPDPSHPSGALILSSASSFLFSPRPVLLVLFSSPSQMSQSYIPHSRCRFCAFLDSTNPSSQVSPHLLDLSRTKGKKINHCLPRSARTSISSGQL